MPFLQQKNQGNEKWASHDFEGALECYYSALKDPSCDDTTKTACYVNISICAEQLGRYDQALSAADSALALSARNVKARFRRGCVLGKMGRLDEAAESVRGALQADPESMQIKRQLLYIEQQQSAQKKTNGFANMIGGLYDDKPAQGATTASSSEPRLPAEFGANLWHRRRAKMLGLPLETIRTVAPFDSEGASAIQLALAERRPKPESRPSESRSMWASFFRGTSDRCVRDFLASIERETRPFPEFRPLPLCDAVETCSTHWGGHFGSD